MSINKYFELKVLIIMSFVAICGMLGTDIHLPSIPHLMNYLRTDKAHMQQSVSIFLLGMGFSVLVYGPLSDKYGRRPIVIFGLALACIASFAAMFATDINTFLLLRLLQGIGSGVCLGVGRTILADVLQGERLATVGAWFSLFLSLSPLFAPALGGYVQRWLGWQANFFILGSVLALSLLAYICFCPETNQHKNPHAFSVSGLCQSYGSLLVHPVFVGATLITGIVAAAVITYATISPMVLQIQYHMNVVEYGWAMAAAGAGNMLSKILTPFAIRTLGSQKTLWFGLVFILLAGVGLLACYLLQMTTVMIILIAAFLATMGQTLTIPGATMRALAPFHDKRGAAGALYGGFQMLVAFAVSAVAGALTYDGVLILIVTYTMLGALGMLVYVALLKQKAPVAGLSALS